MTAVPPVGRRLRRTRRRLVGAAQLTWLRLSLRTLEVLAPEAAAERAFDLWCTLPPGSRARRDARPGPGEVHHLPMPRGGSMVAEVWGAGPTVYLIHGWGGWRGQLGAFVAPLVASGHRVVAFDVPGHGDADPGFLGPRRGTFVEFQEALDVVARFGPAAGAVAHSMGTIALAHAVSTGVLTAERLVLVAPAHGLDEVLDRFVAVLRLSARTRDALHATVEEYTGRHVSDFSLAALGEVALVPPALVVHDRDDRETPFRVAEDVVARWPGATLVESNGLGHHRVLTAPATVAAAVAHIAGRVPVSPA